MNILQNVQFSTEKPMAFSVKKNERIRQFAVALGLGCIMKKHITTVPATLVILKGEINFILPDREFVLKPYDIFEIPVNVEHEVVGILEQNLFMVTQEL